VVAFAIPLMNDPNRCKSFNCIHNLNVNTETVAIIATTTINRTTGVPATNRQNRDFDEENFVWRRDTAEA